MLEIKARGERGHLCSGRQGSWHHKSPVNLDAASGPAEVENDDDPGTPTAPHVKVQCDGEHSDTSWG